MNGPMISIILLTLIFVLACALFFSVGLFYNKLTNRLDELISRIESEPVERPAVTMGTYEPRSALSDSTAPVGLVNSKSPQLVEFEEQEQLRKMNLKPR